MPLEDLRQASGEWLEPSLHREDIHITSKPWFFAPSVPSWQYGELDGSRGICLVIFSSAKSNALRLHSYSNLLEAIL